MTGTPAYYTTSMWCVNCGHEWLLDVPKGELLWQATFMALCPNCGCPMGKPVIPKRVGWWLRLRAWLGL